MRDQLPVPSRRDVLKAGPALATLVAAGAAEPGFRHRSYLGWITDLASRPQANVKWPSMRLDEELLRDYESSFTLLQKLGFNEVSLWGMYVANEWPLDVKIAVTPDRGSFVERLMSSAHR